MACVVPSAQCVGYYQWKNEQVEFEEVVEPKKPEELLARVDNSSLKGKVICGYQGWFTCKGDGTQLGWRHWTANPYRNVGPGNVTVDLWPDMRELSPSERFPTQYKHSDGSPATVFSSANRQTVTRHFSWMRQYGIDGVMLQRFGIVLSKQKLLANNNTVLENVRAGAKQHGRVYSLMYDLTGMKKGSLKQIKTDWLDLVSKQKITNDSTYLKHNGNSLVAIWGVGFNDRNREYSLEECADLISFFKQQSCSVVLGVPTGWRELNRDSVNDDALHAILKSADVVSPWTVGRYANLTDISNHEHQVVGPDLAWCNEHKLEYLPVVFPGFSWSHLHDGKLDQIPRLKGKFFWAQIAAVKRAGASMIYVAMFDETDEGTAIFKCTNDPPVSDDKPFLTYEGLPSDFYLRLTGMASKLLKGEIQVTDSLPFSR